MCNSNRPLHMHEVADQDTICSMFGGQPSAHVPKLHKTSLCKLLLGKHSRKRYLFKMCCLISIGITQKMETHYTIYISAYLTADLIEVVGFK